MFDKLILWIFLFDAKNGLISIKNRNAAYFDIMNFFYWIKKKNQCPCIRIKKTGRRRTGPENRGKSGRSKAAMGPSHGAAETAHGRTMEAAHGGTAEGTATSHKGNAHKRAAPEARPAAGKRGKNQNNENELEHFALPPSLICGGSPAIKKGLTPRKIRSASLAFSLEPDAFASADGAQPRFRVWLLPCYGNSIANFSAL